ncbi:MAG: YqfO family protein [Victivallales bacterium]|nr:YqfO family protein [Victivallales bacterium]
MAEKFYKLEVYVPLPHAEELKAALFAAGAGRIGNYDCCCWQSTGIGQFRPLPGNNAFVGETGKLEKVEELKIEVLCAAENISRVITALKHKHPYETPAFYYWPVNTD